MSNVRESFGGGRLVLYEPIGIGGMAVVHLGRLLVDGRFRTVAVKRPHAHTTATPGALAMLVDEARLSLRFDHPNLVRTLEVLLETSELLIVMEYVAGAPLAQLLEACARSGRRMPPAIAVALVVGVAEGLHEAHEARDERGEPLELVHRDVSPHNVLVGVDGRARVLDFGVAKARHRLQSTDTGQLKGKLRYMAPEQLSGGALDRRVDVFALASVLWECLVGATLIDREGDGAVILQIIEGDFAPVSVAAADPTLAIFDVLLERALARDPDRRPSTTLELASALRAIVAPASDAEVAAWIATVAGDSIDKTAKLVTSVEREAARRERRGLFRSREARWAAGLLSLLGVAGAAWSIAHATDGATAPVAEGRQRVERDDALGVVDAGLLERADDERVEAPQEPSVDASVARAVEATYDGPVGPAKPAPSHAPRAPARASGRARVSCNPPHYIDAKGVQHFKIECLR